MKIIILSVLFLTASFSVFAQSGQGTITVRVKGIDPEMGQIVDVIIYDRSEAHTENIPSREQRIDVDSRGIAVAVFELPPG